MRIVTIKNPIPLDSPFTIISSDYSSGTTLSVEDSSGWKDDDLILVGGLGNEKAESTDIVGTPPSSTTFTISALDHDHSTDESVQCVLWNKFDIQYKTDSTGDWTSLDTSVDIDWTTNETNYKHSDGASNYYYRVRYYNSATNKYSDWSDTTVADASNRSSVASMIASVRKNTKDENEQKATDDDIIGYFNTVQDIVRSMNKKWPWLQDEATINPTTLALPSDFNRAYRLKYNYVNGSDDRTYYLHYLPIVDFQEKYYDNNASESDYLVDYSIDNINSVVKLGPSPETASAILTLVYEKTITDLDSYGDTTIIPLPDLLVAYASARVWKLKSNMDEYNSWMQTFSDLLQVLDQARPVSYHPRTLVRFQGQNVNRNLSVVSEDYIA